MRGRENLHTRAVCAASRIRDHGMKHSGLGHLDGRALGSVVPGHRVGGIPPIDVEAHATVVVIASDVVGHPHHIEGSRARSSRADFHRLHDVGAAIGDGRQGVSAHGQP